MQLDNPYAETGTTGRADDWAAGASRCLDAVLALIDQHSHAGLIFTSELRPAVKALLDQVPADV